jgi:beta-galactosidase
VWLVKTSPLAIAPDGVFVYSRFQEQCPGGPGRDSFANTAGQCQRKAAQAMVTWTVLGPDGKVVAKAERSAKVDAAGSVEVEKVASVRAPELWTPETPKLYRLVTESQAAARSRTEWRRNSAFAPWLSTLTRDSF